MGYNSLKILSLNINGLNSPVKRGKVLTKLKKEKVQVILLQETHLSQTEHEKFKKMGFRNSYYSSYKQGHKRGVIILISNSTKFLCEKEIQDKEGRYVIVKGKLENEAVTLVNVYAPPESDKQFFKSMFNIIAVETEGILICGGDFNIVLNQNLDTTSTRKNKRQLAKFVKLSLEEMGMIDIWRSINPTKKDFTHYSVTHRVYSRIDYFLINKGDRYRVEECTIKSADLSDHNAVYLQIHLNARKKQTIWRLNVGILNNKEIVEDMKKEIRQYVDENNDGEVQPTMVWDALKAVVRGKLIARTTALKKARLTTYKNQTERLRELEQQHQITKEQRVYQQILETKTKINDILLDETGKKCLYLKQSYYEMGPRSTKLLAKRIKKQQAENTIHKIRDPTIQKITYDPEHIEKVFQTYYENLYTQPPAADESEMEAFLNQLDLPSIGTSQNDILTADITLEEINEAINLLKNNKSPGSDGYPAEWYKMFKEELITVLQASFNWTLKENKIPPTWAEAIISVIPKPGKNKEECASYRPISILNIDYKIYTSIISKRLNTFLSELIDEDQTGYIKGRQTQDNIRRTLHIIEQAQKEKQSTVLVSIDAEKAFDCVNWSFLYKVLERLGFNKKSIQLIKSLYKEPTARIKINGNLTDKILLQRSTRQGCCLSPTLFAICIEPLAQAIRQNKEIKGIAIKGLEHKIGLFADDVIAFLGQPNTTLPILMKLLDSYGYLSGYRINISKTQILAINYKPTKVIRENYKLNWSLKSIKYLGVSVTQDLSELYKENYEKLNQNIQKDIERWSTLPLDFNSRIEIVRMNLLPRYLYLFQSLPVEVPQSQFIMWDKIISRFIWGGKRPRIRYETLRLPKDKGGMALPKLKEYFYAAQLRPVYCWCKPNYEARWKEIEKEVNQQPIQNIIGDKELYKKLRKNIDPITGHTLEIWFKILKIYKCYNDSKSLKWLAYDSNFKPAQYDQGFKQWAAKGVTAWCVLEREGQLESFQNLKEKHDLGTLDFYRYLQLRDYYRKEIQADPSGEVNSVIQIIKKAYKESNTRIISAIYRGLNSHDKNSTNYIKGKWEKEFNMEITDDEWLNMWKIHQTSTSSRIWREFSWKNLVRFFITPKMKSKQLNRQQKCWRDCGEFDVDHSHVFWKCHKITVFWEMVCEELLQMMGYGIPMCCNVLYLCNFSDESLMGSDIYLVKILLVASKKAITRNWGKKDPPTKDQWLTIVEGIYTMEKLTHKLRLQEAQMDKKWSKWTEYKKRNGRTTD